ncbi:MAG: hypothetical protein K2K05_04450 [Muribaculaceae bacterium]|nr:hypothetical protein [Muribaculaceae bacterium]
MKKHLLVLAGACVGISAIAAEPTVLPGANFENISPNGEWAAGTDPITYDYVIYNLADGKTYTYSEDAENSTYMSGSGNFISNNGQVVVDVYGKDTAAVWDNGEVTLLPRAEGDRSSTANGITPDGSRICGTIGKTDFTMEEVTMRFPIIWDRAEDGTWQMYEELPYPTLDFTGRVPQYIMAIAISDDGKTIAGQIVDYSGMVMQPIVWNQNEEGEWAYSFPHPELLNPNGVELPEWPGESPEPPSPTKYMTEEQGQAYQAAMDEYFETWENRPNPADYMTETEYIAYMEAMANFDGELEEWGIKFDEYLTIFDEIMSSALIYPRNKVMLSGNVRYYATTHMIDDFWVGSSEGYTVVFDLETGDAYQMKSDVTLATSYINNDGTVLAAQTVQPQSMAYNAWIATSPEEEFIPLNEYIEPKYPSVYTWMEENMRHDMETVDYETWEIVIEPDVWQTGVARADADLKTIVTVTQNIWDYDSEYFTFGYIMNLDGGTSAAFDTAINAFGVKAAKNGHVRINGAAARLEVFDMNGRRVYSIDNPSADVATGLRSGLYIIKAIAKDGNVITTKAAI